MPAESTGGDASRREWDMAEHTARGRERDREARERAAEGEKRPHARKRGGQLPRPTQKLQQHDDLQLDKHLGQTRMVENVVGGGAGGARGPGFFCELCNRMCKDSVGYLDHINGRMHLRRLGQSTQVERSTLEQVRERIRAVVEERAKGATPDLRYDFDARLRQIAEEQRRERDAKREQRRAAQRKPPPEPAPLTEEDAETMAAMGFASFGSSKR